VSLRDNIRMVLSLKEEREYRGYTIRDSKSDPGGYNVYKNSWSRIPLVSSVSEREAEEWIDAQIDKDLSESLSDSDQEKLEDLQSSEYYYSRELYKNIDWGLSEDTEGHYALLDLGIDDFAIVADNDTGDHYAIYVINEDGEPVDAEAKTGGQYILAGTNVPSEIESMLYDQGNQWRQWYVGFKLDDIRDNIKELTDDPFAPNYESKDIYPDTHLINSMFEASYDEDPEETDQTYTYADTSINSSKLPAIYKLVQFSEGDVVLDYGGGRFDNGMDYLESLGCIARVYDPYNRSTDYNQETLRIIRENGGADIVLCSNVLNVIDTESARLTVLKNMKRYMSSNGTCYITVYEGSGSGEGSPTKAGYQLNRKIADYISEVESVFSNVSRKGKLIIAR